MRELLDELHTRNHVQQWRSKTKNIKNYIPLYWFFLEKQKYKNDHRKKKCISFVNEEETGFVYFAKSNTRWHRSWSGGDCGGCSGSAEERQQSDVCRFLLVQEKILRDPECSVQTHDSETDHQSGGQQRPDAGQEHDDDRQDDQNGERLAIREGTSEDGERLIGLAEEVEEDPRAEEAEEDEER